MFCHMTVQACHRCHDRAVRLGFIEVTPPSSSLPRKCPLCYSCTANMHVICTLTLFATLTVFARVACFFATPAHAKSEALHVGSCCSQSFYFWATHNFFSCGCRNRKKPFSLLCVCLWYNSAASCLDTDMSAAFNRKQMKLSHLHVWLNKHIFDVINIFPCGYKYVKR